MKISQESDMNFFVPIEFEKSVNKKTGEKEMKIKGIASTPDKDSDGEILEPVGFDLSRFKSTGFLNYNHGAKNDASKVIGEPTLATITPKGELYVEGKLYSGHPLAESVWNLAETLERNGSSRKIGFSIEGRALERDPMNPRRITRALLTGLAITPMPVNTNTYLDICKGEQREDFLDVKTDEILRKSEESDILYEFEIDDKLYAINKSFEVNEIEKARSGVYKNTSENKKLGRVGQHYGSKKGDNIEDKLLSIVKGREDKGFALGQHFIRISEIKNITPNFRELASYQKWDEYIDQIKKDLQYYETDEFKGKMKENNITQEEVNEDIIFEKNQIQEVEKRKLKLAENFTEDDNKLLNRFSFYYHDGEGGSDFMTFKDKKEFKKSIVPDIEKETDEQTKVKKVMREFKAGTLKDSHGKTVTDRDQALSIAMSESGIEKTMDAASFAPVTKQSIDPKVKVLDMGTKDIIKKALELDIISIEQLIEKSQGEGSRGGNIIGHTRSGKPIYAKNANHKLYFDFSKEDHKDAAAIHDSHARKNRSYNKFNEHLGYARSHKIESENTEK